MADTTIKHFIMMRFFSWHDPNYPHDIFDVDFLSRQSILAQNNSLKSLNNQTNKNFEIVFLLHEKVFSDAKYEFIFQRLRNSIDVPVKFIKSKDKQSLLKDAYDNYDFVIQSILDFDDFVYKDAITDTQSKVDECNNILAYGYCKGYEYRCGNLYPALMLYKNQGWHGILGSFILKSSFAKRISPVEIYTFFHHVAKLKLEEFLKKNDVEFSEDMFQQNTTTDAYIYFRHEFAHYILTHNAGKAKINIPNRPPLTTKDITKKQLEDEFGFTGYELNSIK